MQNAVECVKFRGELCEHHVNILPKHFASCSPDREVKQQDGLVALSLLP
jgi:hypothetical protein